MRSSSARSSSRISWNTAAVSGAGTERSGRGRIGVGHGARIYGRRRCRARGTGLPLAAVEDPDQPGPRLAGRFGLVLDASRSAGSRAWGGPRRWRCWPRRSGSPCARCRATRTRPRVERAGATPWRCPGGCGRRGPSSRSRARWARSDGAGRTRPPASVGEEDAVLVAAARVPQRWRGRGGVRAGSRARCLRAWPMASRAGGARGSRWPPSPRRGRRRRSGGAGSTPSRFDLFGGDQGATARPRSRRPRRRTGRLLRPGAGWRGRNPSSVSSEKAVTLDGTPRHRAPRHRRRRPAAPVEPVQDHPDRRGRCEVAGALPRHRGGRPGACSLHAERVASDRAVAVSGVVDAHALPRTPSSSGQQ